MVPMPYDYLRRICDCSLPLTVTEREDVDELRTYAAAGLVVADIPEPVRLPGRIEQKPATLHALTKAGRQVIESLQKRKGGGRGALRVRLIT